MRTAFFVDGYNLYYGLLHGTAYKWLDVRALLSTILKVQDPRSEVSAIHYFTSLVKPDLASRGVESLTAQKTYIRALVATNIVVTEGKHRLDKAMAPEYVNDQKASRQQQVAIWSLEEKQTDVNIAIAMYRTAVKQQELPEHEQITQLVLVSNDSDFSPAIKAVREDFPNMRIGVMSGNVASVGAQVVAIDSPGSGANYEVIVAMPALSAEQQKRLKLGMSAKLSIITYQNDTAIVIPHEAILKEGNQLFVEYRNMEGAAAERIAVKAGRVSAEGVEVFGLKPGYVRTMNRP